MFWDTFYFDQYGNPIRVKYPGIVMGIAMMCIILIGFMGWNQYQILHCICDKKDKKGNCIVAADATAESFINKSPQGFRYHTDSRQFVDQSDRAKAVQALIDARREAGETYTPEQLASLSDSFIMLALDPISADEDKELKAEMVMLIDPTYKTARVAVLKAQENAMMFEENADRSVVHSLLVAYFARINKPTGVPLEQWPDKLLIRTFITRKLPKQSEFTA